MRPSKEHQTIAEMLREQPRLVFALLTSAGQPSLEPGATATSIGSAFSPALNDLQADTAFALNDTNGLTTRTVIVEVQLGSDREKRYTMPVYQALAHRRYRVPCDVVVLALDEIVASAFRAPVTLGTGSVFTPIVVGPEQLRRMPERGEPEIELLRALALGRRDPRVVLEALKAFDGMRPERGMVFFDLVISAAPEAVRLAMEELMQHQEFEPESELLKQLKERWTTQGRNEGLEKGRNEGLERARAELRSAILGVMRARGLELTTTHEESLRACSDTAVLGEWVRRAAIAASAEDVFRAT